ncbi:MAG TPA: NAD(P)H-binding protein [Terracidiphilus sp.]
MIVLTTPTGNIGHLVLEDLLGGGAGVRVIARDPRRLPSHLRERVEVVEGSHSDTRVVNQAFKGADSVFWLVPPDPKVESLKTAYLDFSRAASDAFRSQGVKRVVVVSALGRGWPRDTGYVSASLAMDDLILSTGVNCRVLTMPSFMDNMLRQVQAIKNQGMFLSLLRGDLKAPACAIRDIASVAARLLLDSSWTGQANVPVLGPEDLSCDEMAQIMSDVLAKPVRYQQISFDAFKTRLIGFGMSESMAQGMIDMMVAKNEGLDNQEPRTPESTTPTSFRQWCEEELKPAVLN